MRLSSCGRNVKFLILNTHIIFSKLLLTHDFFDINLSLHFWNCSFSSRILGASFVSLMSHDSTIRLELLVLRLLGLIACIDDVRVDLDSAQHPYENNFKLKNESFFTSRFKGAKFLQNLLDLQIGVLEGGLNLPDVRKQVVFGLEDPLGPPLQIVLF